MSIDVKGKLDYPDELLVELSWAIVGVHTSSAIGERMMTERVLETTENLHVDCIGHLPEWLLLRRDPYAIDLDRVAGTVVRIGTIREISANPSRRDLKHLLGSASG